MQYSLYQFYSLSSLDLYEIRRHFLWNFYCQNHSRNDARRVLRAVVVSSRIGRIIDKSIQKKHTPNYNDFLSAIKGIVKFWFCSKNTLILATIEAVLRWDIVANKKLNLRNPDELKQDTLKVLKKYFAGKVVPTEDNIPYTLPSSLPMPEFAKSSSEDKHQDTNSESEESVSIRTWSLDEFTNEFGPKMQVQEFANSKTGDLFKSCVFTKGYTRTFVAFSSKLGELTKKEILDMKDELIVLRVQNGKYKLAKHYYT